MDHLKEELQRDGSRFVGSFEYFYKIDGAIAITALLTAFIACYSRMDVPDRMTSLKGLKGLLEDVGLERFEDRSDFIDFIQEKFAERRQQA